LANPNPEIMPEQVDEVRSDAVVFTGRADRKNQANNSNAFPGTLAGGLDVGASVTTDNMALAGAIAMAEIAFEPAPREVQDLYTQELTPGSRDYAVASAFDPRVHFRVAEAVAREAVRSGLAAFPFDTGDSQPYATWFLEQRLKNAFIVPTSPQVLLKNGPSLFSSLLGPEG
jgi:malate dehydrogenase (oxaloacetate-decarboxylating)(NADP+)